MDGPADVLPCEPEDRSPAAGSADDDCRRVRDRLLDLVKERPGINKISACQVLGVAWGTISYHVDRLQRAGRIEVEYVGRDAALFLAGMSPSLKRSSLALRDEAARQLLDVLAHSRQGSLGEISRALGVSRKVGRRLIVDLLAAGLLENQRSVGRPRYVLRRPETFGLPATAQARRPMAMGSAHAAPQAVA